MSFRGLDPKRAARINRMLDHLETEVIQLWWEIEHNEGSKQVGLVQHFKNDRENVEAMIKIIVDLTVVQMLMETETQGKSLGH